MHENNTLFEVLRSVGDKKRNVKMAPDYLKTAMPTQNRRLYAVILSLPCFCERHGNVFVTGM